MKLPKQTEPVSRTERGHDARPVAADQESKGITPTACGCPHVCAGVCLGGLECLGTCG